MAEVGGVQLRFPNLGEFRVPSVDVDILGRVQDMYSGKSGSTPKDSGGTQQVPRALGGIYAGSVLGAIPGIGPALHNLSTAAAAMQTNSGLRSGRIKELASDETKRGTYDSQTNSYSGLGFLDRVMDIKPDAVTSQIAYDRGKALNNSAAIKAIKLEKGEEALNKVFPKGSATSNLEIESLASQLDTRRGLLKDIEANLGTERLTAKRQEVGGRELSNTELRVLNEEAFKSTPEQLRAKAESDAEVAYKGKSGDAAVTTANANETNAAANTLTAQTNRITAINNQRLAEAELGFKQQQLGYERDVAMYGIDAKSREASLDRTLRKDLAVLGLEDKRDSRRYDRERDERKDRQLMIMQLLGGLKNLGSSFAL